MDIYSSVLGYLFALPVLKDWPAARVLVEKAARLEPRDWRLPLLGCEAVGGKPGQAIPAMAALACVQTGIILIDDLLDEDPRGEYRLIGQAQTANFAASLFSFGQAAIIQSQSQMQEKLGAMDTLSCMASTVAFGQYLDSQSPQTEDAYWQVVETKSASFFAAALQLGAWFGGAPKTMVGNVGQFGSLYGVMIQIYDDLNDSLDEPVSPDWIQKRSPLPILFAELVEHPDHARFQELRHDISRPGALREAQNLLIHCGAVSYCVDQLLQRHDAAKKVLRDLPPACQKTLEPLLEDLVAPIKKLLENATPTSGNKKE